MKSLEVVERQERGVLTMSQRADVDGACAVPESLTSHIQVNQGTLHLPLAYANTHEIRISSLGAVATFKVCCGLTQNDTS